MGYLTAFLAAVISVALSLACAVGVEHYQAIKPVATWMGAASYFFGVAPVMVACCMGAGIGFGWIAHQLNN